MKKTIVAPALLAGLCLICSGCTLCSLVVSPPTSLGSPPTWKEILLGSSKRPSARVCEWYIGSMRGGDMLFSLSYENKTYPLLGFSAREPLRRGELFVPCGAFAGQSDEAARFLGVLDHDDVDRYWSRQAYPDCLDIRTNQRFSLTWFDAEADRLYCAFLHVPAVSELSERAEDGAGIRMAFVLDGPVVYWLLLPRDTAREPELLDCSRGSPVDEAYFAGGLKAARRAAAKARVFFAQPPPGLRGRWPDAVLRSACREAGASVND